MSETTDRMGQLARIARTRAETDLRRYAAFRAQADAMERQIRTARAELGQAIAAPPVEGLDRWRLTTALVGYRAGQLHRAEASLARMKPGLDAARASAVQAFGRAEALVQMQRLTLAREQRDRERRGP